MTAYLDSLFLANISNDIRSAALLVLEAGESDKGGEFPTKNQFFHSMRSYVTQAAYWASLFAVTDSPCAQLACLRRASPALSLPRSWNCLNKFTRDDELKILASEPNEKGDYT